MKIIDKETGKVIAIITSDTVRILDTQNYTIENDKEEE